jgi:hypothetical protein
LNGQKYFGKKELVLEIEAVLSTWMRRLRSGRRG